MMQKPLLVAVARRGAGVRAMGPLGIVAAAASNIQDWATGAEGRRRTQRVLRTLERTGWQVNHDIGLPGGGTVDHLLVGPCGIYVLASRAWGGVVTVDHKGATITPSDNPCSAWTAHGQHRDFPPAGAAIVRALAAATGRPVPAPRVGMVIWAPFPEGIAVSGGMTYVAGDHLAGWLAGQPRRMDSRQLTALAAVDVTTDLIFAPSSDRADGRRLVVT